jgi:formate hydrogenlyase subunit 3/multisubunit Na+/H+ antiporter MnhD subunit
MLFLFSAFTILSCLAYGLQYLEKIEKDSYLAFLWILLMPGIILYIFVTGDIHGCHQVQLDKVEGS